MLSIPLNLSRTMTSPYYLPLLPSLFDFSFLVIEQLVLFVCHEARACYTRDLYSSWMLSSALLTIRSSLDLQFSVSKEFDICMCYYLGITWPIVHRSSSLNEAL